MRRGDKDWQLRVWFDRQSGDDCWMVCRAGHLWQAQVPYYGDFDDRDTEFGRRMARPRRERMRRVTRCPMCTVLKETGMRIRGLTFVCPDYRGLITEARLLDGGTIEHHHPEQVAQVYSPEAVKEWRAMLALISLHVSMERRAARKHLKGGR